MSAFRNMSINATGLAAERLRMDTISSNIANANSTRTEDGGPYRRKIAVFEEHLVREKNKYNGKNEMSSGVRAVGIYDSPDPLPHVYDPSHPDADALGYVEMPNVNLLTEMIDMMASRRAYEANITAFNTSKSLMMKTLEIGR